MRNWWENMKLELAIWLLIRLLNVLGYRLLIDVGSLTPTLMPDNTDAPH